MAAAKNRGIPPTPEKPEKIPPVLALGGTLCGNIKFFHQIAFQRAENVIFIEVRRFLARENLLFHLVGNGDFHILRQKCDNLRRCAVFFRNLFRQRKQNVALRDAAALVGLGNRIHIAVEIQRYAIRPHQFRDVIAHLPIALVAAETVISEKIV